MKKLFATLLLAASIGTAAQAQYSNEFIKMGQKAPELAFQNPEGKTLKLSELNKGRYILLDFWASWCGPCRRANPGLVAFYNRYKDKEYKGAKNGFTIVSVSLDQSKDAWMQAISSDKLVWPFHMSDLGGWQSKPAEIYGVQFVPQAFLIGPDGKILGKYMTSEAAEEDLKKYVK